LGFDFDASGHLTVTVLEELGVPLEADFYLCGPPAFLADFTAGLGRWGVAPDRIHTELFGSGKSITPGVAEAARRARAGLTVSWNSRFNSLLEFAEACDVPVRWSCRAGVCHTCECGLISGSVKYDPEPLDAPAVGNLLICVSRPQEDTVIDL
jgi:ferredoxin